MADGVATPYLRCGAGPAVLLLSLDRELAVALGTAFRVTAALPPNGYTAAADEWLCGIFDGLGLQHAVIASPPDLHAAAKVFATREPDRVRGIVVFTPVNRSAKDYATLIEAIARIG